MKKTIFMIMVSLIVCSLLVACGSGSSSTDFQNENTKDDYYEEDTDEYYDDDDDYVDDDNYDSEEVVLNVDYDEIVAEGDGYYLCKKNESDFSSSKDYYGIYNFDSESWALEYMEIGSEINGSNIEYCGSGIFSFRSSEKVYFISPDYKGVFEVKIPEGTRVEECGHGGYYFYGGRTMTSVWGGTASKPVTELCVITSKGDVSPVKKPKSKHSTRGMYSCDEDCAVIYTSDYNSDEIGEIMIYDYSEKKFIVISDPDYTNRLDIKNYDTEVYMEGDRVIFNNLLGVDGEYYHAEFDKNGNLAVPAEKQE